MLMRFPTCLPESEINCAPEFPIRTRSGWPLMDVKGPERSLPQKRKGVMYVNIKLDVSIFSYQ